MGSREIEETKTGGSGGSQPRGARLGTGSQQELPQDLCLLASFLLLLLEADHASPSLEAGVDTPALR